MVLMLVAVNGSVIYLHFGRCMSRFPSSPLTTRVPLFLLFGFNKGTQKEKG